MIVWHVCPFVVVCLLCMWIVSAVVTVKPVPVASHTLPPQPARPTATATAAPVKKVAPPAVAPALPKVNIPAVEKGKWRCDWHGLAVDINSCDCQRLVVNINSCNWQSLAISINSCNWQRLAVSSNGVLSYAGIQFKNTLLLFSRGSSNCDDDTQCDDNFSHS